MYKFVGVLWSWLVTCPISRHVQHVAKLDSDFELSMHSIVISSKFVYLM